MVICDLQGSASVAMIHAIHYADLVLIPVQPSNDDLKSCHSTARHVTQAGKSARRTIPYRIVISRASTGFRPEVERVIEQALENARLPRLKTPVFERRAFKRASFSRVATRLRGPGGRGRRQSEGGLCRGARHLGRNSRGDKAKRMNAKLVTPELGPVDEDPDKHRRQRHDPTCACHRGDPSPWWIRWSGPASSLRHPNAGTRGADRSPDDRGPAAFEAGVAGGGDGPQG